MPIFFYPHSTDFWKAAPLTMKRRDFYIISLPPHFSLGKLYKFQTAFYPNFVQIDGAKTLDFFHALWYTTIVPGMRHQPLGDKKDWRIYNDYFEKRPRPHAQRHSGFRS